MPWRVSELTEVMRDDAGGLIYFLLGQPRGARARPALPPRFPSPAPTAGACGLTCERRECRR